MNKYETTAGRAAPARWIMRWLSGVVALVLLAGVCLGADKQPNDDLVRDRVMLKVGSDPDAKVGGLDVEAKQGVVTLTGTVETEAQKDKAGRLARKVKGVKQVINNINLRDRSAAR
jgi:hyperosmotically inducible periplasmic protein